MLIGEAHREKIEEQNLSSLEISSCLDDDHVTVDGVLTDAEASIDSYENYTPVGDKDDENDVQISDTISKTRHYSRWFS